MNNNPSQRNKTSLSHLSQNFVIFAKEVQALRPLSSWTKGVSFALKLFLLERNQVQSTLICKHNNAQILIYIPYIVTEM